MYEINIIKLYYKNNKGAEFLMSDLGKLIELIKMAQGDRSLNTFAM